MALKVLCDHILKEGRCMEGGILKVDLFLNHQMDPYLMKQTAIEFIRRFADLKINKILTIEASGIATMDDYYQTEVRSFTKQRSYNVAIYKEYLTADDHVLFIDDFLAFGNASIGILDLCRQAGATIEGMGFLIEKEFQGGRHLLQLEGISRIESLAIIESLTDSQIKIKND